MQKLSHREEEILKLMDLGVEDVEEKGEAIFVFTSANQLKAIEDKVNQAGFPVLSSELVRRPINPLPRNVKQEVKIINFIKLLEKHEDVQKVYTNQSFA